MAVTVVNRPGQANATGAIDALMLTKFSGEILTEFEQANVMMPLHNVRDLPPGAKAVQFPQVGEATAGYHTPGENILLDADADTVNYLNTIRQGERLIYADRKLISSVFIDNLDEKLNHWDARREYTRMLGRALAKQLDRNLLGLMYNAANTTAVPYTGAPDGGGLITAATMATDPIILVQNIFAAARRLDDEDVPREDRFLVVSPATMEVLFVEPGGSTLPGLEWVNSDFNGATGNGSMREGRLPRLAGFTILVSTNFSDFNKTDLTNGYYPGSDRTGTSGAGDYNQYSTAAGNDYSTGDFGVGITVEAFAFHRSALGTAKVQDMSVEVAYLPEYQGHLVVAKYVMGHGILHPESAVVLRDS